MLFVADIHLCQQESAITTGFIHFLHTRALKADALYILGDLFEVWIGDDDPNPLYQDIALALKVLNQRGIPCYFINGNRDFLLSSRYATACAMTLLPEQQVLQLDRQRVVILHGDVLCTDDKAYQSFRRMVHQRWLKQLFLYLPLSLRLLIADRIRANSQRANVGKTDNIMDVNQQAVMAVMTYTGASVMIHGHTHQPAIHTMDMDNCHYRAVLGSWHQQGSAIKIDAAGVTLVEFPFCS